MLAFFLILDTVNGFFTLKKIKNEESLCGLIKCSSLHMWGKDSSSSHRNVWSCQFRGSVTMLLNLRNLLFFLVLFQMAGVTTMLSIHE